uniref:Uncharacterized protein n=1 Tax=Meloidogyne incognita TaxID=6306 RepID=A0A914NDM5_MELIC
MPLNIFIICRALNNSALFNNSACFNDLLPCQFPSSNPSELATFCQLPYHQVPLICDPGGILSRTEAELIGKFCSKI